MSLPRVRLEGSRREGDSLWILDQEQGRHLIAVRRCREGDLFEGLLPGKKFTLRLKISGSEARGILVSASPEEASPRIWLLAGLLKSEPFDRLVAQSVEAGASVIVPLLCSRSVVSVDPSKIGRKMERWHRIILEATKQCGAATPTEIFEPVEPSAIGSIGLPASRFAAMTSGTSDIFRFRPSQEAAIAVGPEGDWTEEEIEILGREGFVPVRLGPRIMRSQTAAVVGVACLSLVTTVDRNDE
ncbi:MAG: RsmE family RNA methyltransferase [Thermovirgaceae bacterium]|nr:RsmE family RNA methyltransferase [Thermovirgaceae bacterium]